MARHSGPEATSAHIEQLAHLEWWSGAGLPGGKLGHPMGDWVCQRRSVGDRPQPGSQQPLGPAAHPAPRGSQRGPPCSGGQRAPADCTSGLATATAASPSATAPGARPKGPQEPRRVQLGRAWPATRTGEGTAGMQPRAQERPLTRPHPTPTWNAGIRSPSCTRVWASSCSSRGPRARSQDSASSSSRLPREPSSGSSHSARRW